MKFFELRKPARLLAGAALMTAAAILSSAHVEAKPVEIKFGSYQHENHLFMKIARQVLPELEKKTEGRYKFGIYPSEALGKAAEQLDMTNRGLVPVNLVCMCYYPGTYPLLSIETVPIWTNGVAGVRNAFRGGLDKLYEEYLHSKGLTNVGYLGATAFSVRSFGGKGAPIRTPADMKDKRVRTLGLERVVVQESGGAVMTMAMPQVVEALERNMLNALFAQESNWIDWKLYESLDYLNFLDVTTSPMSIIYSKRDIEAIDERDRAAVLEVLAKFMDELDAAYGKFMDDGRKFLTSEWKGKAFYPSPEEKQAFVKVAHDAAVKEFLSRAGEMGPRAIEIVKKFNP